VWGLRIAYATPAGRTTAIEWHCLAPIRVRHVADFRDEALTGSAQKSPTTVGRQRMTKDIRTPETASIVPRLWC